MCDRYTGVSVLVAALVIMKVRRLPTVVDGATVTCPPLSASDAPPEHSSFGNVCVALFLVNMCSSCPSVFVTGRLRASLFEWHRCTSYKSTRIALHRFSLDHCAFRVRVMSEVDDHRCNCRMPGVNSLVGGRTPPTPILASRISVSMQAAN